MLQFGVTIPLSQLLAACGGGGGGDDEHKVTPDHTPPTVEAIDKATFLIVYKHAARNGGRVNVTPLLTGFSITDKYIATNAHGTVGVMDRAIALYPEHEITGVSAYQAATGEEFPLILAVTHPSYTNTASPDVGMFVTTRPMTDHLKLAPATLTAAIKRTDPITMSGFPGELYPGFTEDTIPVATVFSGTIQAFRMFDERASATPNNWEVLDHSAQATGGTSGSPILFNNFVVALNNAGPGTYVLTPPTEPNGQPGRRTIASGANNFAVNVRFLHELVELHEKGGMAPRDHQVLPPLLAEVAALAPKTRNYTGRASTNEEIKFTVGLDGKYSGTSSRGQGVTLSGRYFTAQELGTPQASGRLLLTDNVQPVPAQNIYPRLYSIDFNPQTLAVGGNGVVREQRGNTTPQVGTWALAG